MTLVPFDTYIEDVDELPNRRDLSMSNQEQSPQLHNLPQEMELPYADYGYAPYYSYEGAPLQTSFEPEYGELDAQTNIFFPPFFGPFFPPFFGFPFFGPPFFGPFFPFRRRFWW
jgi:hypothetical protein